MIITGTWSISLKQNFYKLLLHKGEQAYPNTDPCLEIILSQSLSINMLRHLWAFVQFRLISATGGCLSFRIVWCTLFLFQIVSPPSSQMEFITASTVSEFLYPMILPITLLIFSISLWNLYVESTRDSRCDLPLPPGNVGLPFVGETLKLAFKVRLVQDMYIKSQSFSYVFMAVLQSLTMVSYISWMQTNWEPFALNEYRRYLSLHFLQFLCH